MYIKLYTSKQQHVAKLSFLSIHSIENMMDSSRTIGKISRQGVPNWALEERFRSFLLEGGLRTSLHGFCTSSTGICTSLGWFECNISRTWRNNSQTREKKAIYCIKH